MAEPGTGGSGDKDEAVRRGGVLGRSREDVLRRTRAARERYEGSSAESVWRRLNAMDFINQGMQFAALLLLAFLPFIIVVSSLAGRDAATGIARHLGLNHEATMLVGQVFNPASKTAAVLNIRGILFALLGGIGTAGTLQVIYERIFDLPSRGMKDFHRQLVWIAVIVGAAALGGFVGPHVRSVPAGPVLLGLLSFVFVSALWFFTMWLLLGNRVPRRKLLPPAVATGAFWLGLGIFSKFFFSNTIIGDYREYGSIGVVFGLMSWLIAVGVVIILGAVVGIVWEEHGLSFMAAVRRVAKTSRAASSP